jgi:hypothetical protein
MSIFVFYVGRGARFPWVWGGAGVHTLNIHTIQYQLQAMHFSKAFPIVLYTTACIGSNFHQLHRSRHIGERVRMQSLYKFYSVREG